MVKKIRCTNRDCSNQHRDSDGFLPETKDHFGPDKWKIENLIKSDSII